MSTTTLKRYLIIATTTVSIVLLVGLFTMWLFNSNNRQTQQIANVDPVGKEFLALYPGAINYESTNNTTIYLQHIAGTTMLAAEIPTNANVAAYRVQCYQTGTKTDYDVLTGLSDSMIAYIKAESCFDHEPSYEKIKEYLGS